MKSSLEDIDSSFAGSLRRSAVPTLRIALGIVFLWFGILKLLGSSPVEELIKQTYSFFPPHTFLIILGIWESAIGLGLIFKVALRFTLAILFLQMAGTLFAVFLAPEIFFSNGNPLLLTTQGEFVVKNFVLIAAALVIWGYEAMA